MEAKSNLQGLKTDPLFHVLSNCLKLWHRTSSHHMWCPTIWKKRLQPKKSTSGSGLLPCICTFTVPSRLNCFFTVPDHLKCLWRKKGVSTSSVSLPQFFYRFLNQKCAFYLDAMLSKLFLLFMWPCSHSCVEVCEVSVKHSYVLRSLETFVRETLGRH